MKATTKQKAAQRQNQPAVNPATKVPEREDPPISIRDIDALNDFRYAINAFDWLLGETTDASPVSPLYWLLKPHFEKFEATMESIRHDHEAWRQQRKGGA